VIPFDLPSRKRELEELERKAQSPDFWADQSKAQEVLGRIRTLKELIEPLEELGKEVEEALELLELAEEEGDIEVVSEIESQARRLLERAKELELKSLLTDPYDPKDAFLAINAGEGGKDAMDWVDILTRMYLKWCKRKGFETEIVDHIPGEEAGTRSITIAVRGPYAYGLLKAERGVHRLVRISPFDASRRRHTSFASVDVLPDVGEIEVKINPEDLKIETFKSSGPGGQHMQKTQTAVRITHLPTGITVKCETERSQARNKEIAMRILAARLFDYYRRKREEELERLRGEKREAAWGNQIRSYVMQPYRMVKDHRTGVETSNLEAVLDGDLDEFIRAELLRQRGSMVKSP